MPYLSFDLDALERVPDAADSAGMRPGDMTYGLLRLWRHCWREKADTVNADHLCGFFPGTEFSRLVRALSSFGFIDGIGPYRVRGADRYLRITAARSKGGKTASGNLRRGNESAGRQPELKPGSVPAQAGEQPGVSPGSRPALTANSEQRAANSEQRIPEGVGAFDDEIRRIFRDARGVDYEPPPADAIASRSLMTKPLAEVLRRWAIALVKPFPACSDLSTLVRNWNAYATADPPKGDSKPKDVRRGRVAAEDVDWSNQESKVSNDFP